jgi:acetyltransferase
VAVAVAEEVCAARHRHLDKPVLTCWLGDGNARAVGGTMAEAGLPLYATPDEAVRGFGHLVLARRAREALTDAPARTREPVRDLAAARAIIADARAQERTLLHESEAKALLRAYGIPVVQTHFAPTVGAIEEVCGRLRPPYAVKVVSPDITHKSDVGGVALNLPTRKAAARAACEMETQIAALRPGARIAGFSVQEMASRAHAQEVFAGIATDPTFGPVIMFGAGGTAIEVLADRALTLAPIDDAQARALIDKTRIARLLAGYRNVPAADLDALASVLDAVSAIAVDLPDVVELDVNPLLVDADGVVALDARVRITPEPEPQSRLTIRPVPSQWTAELVTRTGFKTFVRPVRADDEELLAAFFARVSPDDLRFRFLGGVTEVGHDRLAMMTRVDYRRTISFLAFDEAHDEVVATVMLAADPDRTRAEVALTTRADMKDQGLSWVLFEHVLRYARAERIAVVEAVEYADHAAALRMEREMGFKAVADPSDPTLCIMRCDLSEPAP